MICRLHNSINSFGFESHSSGAQECYHFLHSGRAKVLWLVGLPALECFFGEVLELCPVLKELQSCGSAKHNVDCNHVSVREKNSQGWRKTSQVLNFQKYFSIRYFQWSICDIKNMELLHFDY